LRGTRHDGRSLAARSIAAVVTGGRSLGADREGSELTRGKTVGMHELDVQMERLRVCGFWLAVRRMPLQTDGRMWRIFRQLTLTLSFAGNLPQRRILHFRVSRAALLAAAPEVANPCVECSIRSDVRRVASAHRSCQIKCCWLDRSTPIAGPGHSRRRIYSNKPTLSPQLFGALSDCRIVLTTDIHRYCTLACPVDIAPY
jgi:hypothetical protein